MPLRAADSWLVEDGRVRGWELHWARFAAAAGVDVSALEVEVRSELPREGRWFPRVECTEGGELSWRLREAPDRRPTVECLAEPLADFRRNPRVKGPDLEELIAARPDPSEALLADSDGTVLEGCLTSLLWWERETLCVVDDAAPILDGVTRRLLISIAGDCGVAVNRRRPRVEELLGREVWLTSALHGIRAVSAWAPDGPPAAPAPNAPAWQAKLEALAITI